MTDRKRDPLPKDYQFGDAIWPVTVSETRVWALCRCGVQIHDQKEFDTHRCGVTANVIEGDHGA